MGRRYQVAAMAIAALAWAMVVGVGEGEEVADPEERSIAAAKGEDAAMGFAQLIAGVMTPAVGVAPGHGSEVWEHEGMRISFGMDSGPRGDLARLVVTDAESGKPVSGLKPRAWLEARGSDESLDAAACDARVKALMSGSLAARADVDLNALRVLLLNDDNTLSVINPQIALKQTRLEAILRLPGEVADWVQHPDGRSIYLSIPSVSEVWVVETQRFRVASRVAMPARPGALAVSPEGRHLWVGAADESASFMSVIDTHEHRLVGEVEVGPGPHRVAFSHQGHRVWVAGAHAGALVAIDGPSLRRVGAVEVGVGVVSVVREGERLVVARRSGEVRIFDLRGGTSERLSLGAGVDRLDVAPGGRWGFAVHEAGGQVDVLDLSEGRVRGSFKGLVGPEKVVFTKGYAYIESAVAEQLAMVALDDLQDGRPELRSFAIGALPGGGSLARASRGSLGTMKGGASAAPGPGGKSLFVASPDQRAIVVFGEGQSAAIGRWENRVGRARAIGLLDRSLQEIAPGVYSVAVRGGVGREGSWEVRLALGEGGSALCF